MLFRYRPKVFRISQHPKVIVLVWIRVIDPAALAESNSIQLTLLFVCDWLWFLFLNAKFGRKLFVLTTGFL